MKYLLLAVILMMSGCASKIISYKTGDTIIRCFGETEFRSSETENDIANEDGCIVIIHKGGKKK